MLKQRLPCKGNRCFSICAFCLPCVKGGRTNVIVKTKPTYSSKGCPYGNILIRAKHPQFFIFHSSLFIFHAPVRGAVNGGSKPPPYRDGDALPVGANCVRPLLICSEFDWRTQFAPTIYDIFFELCYLFLLYNFQLFTIHFSLLSCS